MLSAILNNVPVLLRALAPSANPTINGAEPRPESKQVGNSTPRPTPKDGSGPRNPRQGGL